jgi:hydrogenase maturation protease
VVALGQRLAGDDAVGFAVTARLRTLEAPVETTDVSDATELVDLVASGERLVVVDALVGGRSPGLVRCVTLGELAARSSNPVSSHGMSLLQAVALGGALRGAAADEVAVVAVEIEPPTGLGEGLSPAVAQAVDAAAQLALALATREESDHA